MGWKKVEYIYTEREKSFVGITIVFVILSLCGHLVAVLASPYHLALPPPYHLHGEPAHLEDRFRI